MLKPPLANFIARLVQGTKSNCNKGPSGHQIMQNTWFGGFSIPQVTIKTGLKTPDGREELLTEYFCDHPGCHNIASHVLGCAGDLCLVVVVCSEHAPKNRS
jgi:hypothetical protein